MRLIDAEALKEKITKDEYESAVIQGFASQLVDTDVFLDYIDNAPTIEAKPVVHAHWKEWYPPKEFVLTGEERLFICSCCDAKFETVENSRYCPYCGAQMDEEMIENET